MAKSGDTKAKKRPAAKAPPKSPPTDKMTVVQIRAELKKLGLGTTGLKAELLERLQMATHVSPEKTGASPEKSGSKTEAALREPATPKTPISGGTPKQTPRGSETVKKEGPKFWGFVVILSVAVNSTALISVDQVFNKGATMKQAALFAQEGAASTLQKSGAFFECITTEPSLEHFNECFSGAKVVNEITLPPVESDEQKYSTLAGKVLDNETIAEDEDEEEDVAVAKEE